nr:hypothetical protein [uncultured Draconibacterium sp.]
MPYNRRTGEYYESRGNRGYSRGYRNDNRQPKKKSGCRLGQDKKGRPCITFWNVSKTRGFISGVAVPCDKAKTKSPNSDKWVVSVRFPTKKETFTGFYNVNSKKLTIPDLAMVANPSKDYFGTYIKRK